MSIIISNVFLSMKLETGRKNAAGLSQNIFLRGRRRHHSAPNPRCPHFQNNFFLDNFFSLRVATQKYLICRKASLSMHTQPMATSKPSSWGCGFELCWGHTSFYFSSGIFLRALFLNAVRKCQFSYKKDSFAFSAI